MIPAGYIAKKIQNNPEWLKTSKVEKIYSVSGCISVDFSDYIKYWKHNKFWFFDSEEIIDEIIKSESKDIFDYEILFYMLYEKEFDEDAKVWKEFTVAEEFGYNIKYPKKKIALGFDIVSYSSGSSHECSPLSCNGLSESVPVNKYCLVDTIYEAIKIAEDMNTSKGEPGPYRIIQVNKIV